MAPPARIRRLVYLGTPQVAVEPLEALVDAGFDVALVVSGPDKRRGRGSELTPSPVKAAALALGIPVSDRVEDALRVDADLGVVVAFGHIIATDILEQMAMVNIHFSLLPRWRGAAPVERAILAGDRTTGVCVMEVVEELDAGGIYRFAEVPIGPDQTVEELRSQLTKVGANLLVSALGEGLGVPTQQVGEVVYAAKIKPSDLELDWSATAVELNRIVRVGGAWTTCRGDRLKIWRAGVTDRADLRPGQVDGAFVGTSVGALELGEVQAAGKARRSATEWVNGVRLSNDDRLGE